MAINESFSSGSGNSVTTTPTELASDVIIDGTWNGRVFLEVLAPGSTEWVVLYQTSTDDAILVQTPDTAVNYRFRYVDISGTVNVYFGP